MTDPDAKPEDPVKVPRGIIVLDCVYLGALVGLGLTYRHRTWFHHAIPSELGPVSVGVPWWGALGGVTISISGVVKHSHDWESEMTLWHVFKPFLGAIAGAVSVLIFGLLVASTSAKFDKSGTTFFVLAFIVGYREDIFRQFIKKAADLLLAQGPPTPKPGEQSVTRCCCPAKDSHTNDPGGSSES